MQFSVEIGEKIVKANGATSMMVEYLRFIHHLPTCEKLLYLENNLTFQT